MHTSTDTCKTLEITVNLNPRSKFQLGPHGEKHPNLGQHNTLVLCTNYSQTFLLLRLGGLLVELYVKYGQPLTA